MTDIFISYAHEDHELVRILVPKLEAEGFSVWWDHTIPPGKTWDEVIAKGIADAKCCIVVWSQHSINSDWVKEEATMAKEGRKFIPVQIDGSEPPVGFRRIQAANLQGWRGEPSNAQWQLLVREARAIVTAAREGGSGASVPPSRPSYAYAPPPAAEPTKKSPPIALIGSLVAAAIAFVVIAAWLWPKPETYSYEEPGYETGVEVTEAPAETAPPVSAPSQTQPATPAPGAQANALDGLMGTWTRTSAAGTCRDTYAFRRSGNQVIWTQNQDEYPRDFTVSGQRVTLGSSWQFEPSGNTLNIYDDNQLICSFRRGGAAATAAPATPSLAGNWTIDFDAPGGDVPWEVLANGTFRHRDGSYSGTWTQSGANVTFYVTSSGITHNGRINGNRISGTYNGGGLSGTFEMRRGDAAATVPSIAGTRWRGVVANTGREPYTITYRFNQDGSAEWRFEDNEEFSARQFHRWTQSGNQIHFHFEDQSGRQNYDGTINGNVMEGRKTGLTTGTFRLVRQN